MEKRNQNLINKKLHTKISIRTTHVGGLSNRFWHAAKHVWRPCRQLATSNPVPLLHIILAICEEMTPRKVYLNMCRMGRWEW